MDFIPVDLKGDGERVCLDVAEIEERGGQLNRVVHLRNTHIHGKILRNDLRVGSQIVHAVAEDRNGVGLRFGPAVLGILDLHRPRARSRSIDEHHFEVVDIVAGSPGCRPTVGEIVAEVDRSVRCGDFQVKVVHKLCV